MLERERKEADYRAEGVSFMVKQIFPLACSKINHRWWWWRHRAPSTGLISTFLDSVAHLFGGFCFVFKWPQSNRRSSLDRGWVKGTWSMIVTFVPVLIFKNSECLILKASPERAELKNSLPTPPPGRRAESHPGRKVCLTELLIHYCDFFLCC